MTADSLEDDEYVANLLKEDARRSAKKYEMVGLDAFLPQRYVRRLQDYIQAPP